MGIPCKGISANRLHQINLATCCTDAAIHARTCRAALAHLGVERRSSEVENDLIEQGSTRRRLDLNYDENLHARLARLDAVMARFSWSFCSSCVRVQSFSSRSLCTARTGSSVPRHGWQPPQMQTTALCTGNKDKMGTLALVLGTICFFGFVVSSASLVRLWHRCSFGFSTDKSMPSMRAIDADHLLPPFLTSSSPRLPLAC